MKIEDAVTVLRDYRNFLLVAQDCPIETKTIIGAITTLLHDRLEIKSCNEPVTHRINITDMTCYDCGKSLITNPLRIKEK